MSGSIIAAFHRGLAEAGYVEGRNVMIDYRWADGHYDRLPAMAADLASIGPPLIVAADPYGRRMAARAATATIPIIFSWGADPVESGLVSSL